MTVNELAALENLNEFRLTDTEVVKAIDVLSKMDNEVKRLLKINTEDVDVMVHCMPMTNVFREDIRKQVFSRKDLLDGAPEHNEDSWIVPRLVK